MSVPFSAIRWTSPAVAEALYEVKALAPRLSNLLYDPVVPERSLDALLDWAEIAAVPGVMMAFRPPLLEDVLPALVRAYIATHTYSLHPASEDGDAERLVLRDTGHGAVVGRIMMLITEVVAPVLGAEGLALADKSRSDLARHLLLIADKINAH